MAYIYKIVNKINNKIYIGKTSSTVEERFKEHCNDSKKIRCEKRPLYDAMNKYGIDKFYIEMIEQVPNDEIASQREMYWIKTLRTYIGFQDCNGYNATLGGDSGGTSINKKSVIGVINDLKTTSMKHKEIAQKWNMSIEMVQGINTGRYYFQDNIEYPLQKSIYNKPNRFEKKYCIDCGKEINKRSIRCKKCNDIYIGKLARVGKLPRPTKEELLKLLEKNLGNFTLIGRIYGVTDNTIRKWCSKYNLPTHTSDYRHKN